MRKKVILSKKVKLFGECITRGMTIRAIQAGAVNLSQGFPEIDPPQEMINAAVKSIYGHRNYYADMRGDPILRDAVAKYTKRFSGFEVDAEENVTITCGTTEAMLASLLALIDSEDELILFQPWYENYYPQAVLSGAKVKYYNLEPPEYKIDLNRLENLFSFKTKAIILNTPNNPTGRVFSIHEMNGIAYLCKKYDTIALVDEIYQHIIFDEHKHIPLASLPEMFDRVVTINGISKAFAATGWRVGWAIASKEITLAIRRVHDFTTATVPTPFQDAAIVGLNLPDSFFDSVKRSYTKKRKLLEEPLKEAQFNFFSPQGTYYIMSDISNFGFKTSADFVNILLHEAGVAVVPGHAYYKDPKLQKKVVRFTFSKDDETIIQAGEKILSWIKKR